MANKPISVSRANQLISEYRAYMIGLGVDMSSQTQAVSFNAGILAQWLNNVLPNTDELRISLGVYPSGEGNAGKLTVALWPYKNGQPATEEVGGVAVEIEPFNEGQKYP